MIDFTIEDVILDDINKGISCVTTYMTIYNHIINHPLHKDSQLMVTHPFYNLLTFIHLRQYLIYYTTDFDTHARLFAYVSERYARYRTNLIPLTFQNIEARIHDHYTHLNFDDFCEYLDNFDITISGDVLYLGDTSLMWHPLGNL